jgi:Ca2+-binding EF-hand superfamily protein
VDPHGTEEAWTLLGGKAKGFLSLKEYYEMYDAYMPKGFDRDLALELFSELDSDKDGKLTYKDFHDTMLFEL